jgi:PAS domain-containing protein
LPSAPITLETQCRAAPGLDAGRCYAKGGALSEPITREGPIAPRAASGNLSGAATTGVATAGTPAANADLNLPAREYAVVLRLRTSPSVVVVSDSGNLPASADLPLEVFAEPEFLATGGTLTASQDNLARAGLDRLFGSDPTHCVASVPLSGPTGAWGTLLVKASSGEMPEIVKRTQRTCGPALDAFASRAANVATQYEWEILSQVGRCNHPCVVVDPDTRVVAANALMCEILGKTAEEMIGTPMDEFIQLEIEAASEGPPGPEPVEFATSVLLKPLFLFFTSSVTVSRLDTVCGRRTMLVFHDLYADRRTGNSNILLIQKLSTTALADGPPQNVVRKMLNMMVMTLSCDLMCVLRRKQDRQMIVTPHSSRRIDMLRANVLDGSREPLLDPFFVRDTAVYCDDVEGSCPEGSFFRQISAVSRFALVPVGDSVRSEYAVLATWSNPDATFASETIPLLKIMANLLGTVLIKIRMVTENQQEKENLRRYTKLTAGRETRMAALKRENAQLNDLVRRLDSREEEQSL